MMKMKCDKGVQEESNAAEYKKLLARIETGNRI
jgi:hypothetical protein